MTSLPAILDLRGRLIMVTGATQGIGRHVALQLGRRGAHIIAVGRTVKALEALDDALQQQGCGGGTLVPLDLSAPTLDQDIARLAQELAQRWGKLDGLITCAAHHEEGLTPLTDVTLTAWNRTMGVNLTAVYVLLRHLTPLLCQAPQPRVVVTTCTTWRDHPYWAAYNASKAGLEALVASYQQEMGHTSMHISLFDPGPTATALTDRAFPGVSPSLYTSPAVAAQKLLDFFHPS